MPSNFGIKCSLILVTFHPYLIAKGNIEVSKVRKKSQPIIDKPLQLDCYKMVGFPKEDMSSLRKLECIGSFGSFTSKIPSKDQVVEDVKED
jgi:hypothetical protein